jgi:hypothetical protein
MITHRTFYVTKVLLTGNAALRNWEQVRDEAQAFIASEISDEDVVGITESSASNGPYLFSVTVWYRKR